MEQATSKQISYAKQIENVTGIEMPIDKTFDNINRYIKDNQQNFFKEKNKILRDKICSEIPIIDLAAEQGFSLVRKGHYYSVKEHDSIRIDSAKNCYWQNSKPRTGRSAEGGSVIDFAVNVCGMSISDAMKTLSQRVIGNEPVSLTHLPAHSVSDKAAEKKEFVLPEKANNMHRIYAYLIKSRYISPEVVNKFVSNKMLYQDTHGNCVFVARENEKPVFACFRGTNTEKRFMGDVFGSDYLKGFHIQNKSTKLVITESVIDAMSIMTIMQEKNIPINDYDYLPLASAWKYDSLIQKIKDNNYAEVFLGLDNDETGIKCLELISNAIEDTGMNINVVKLLPVAHDWNDELKEATRTGKRYKDIQLELHKQSEKQTFLDKALKKEIAQGFDKFLDTEMEIGC